VLRYPMEFTAGGTGFETMTPEQREAWRRGSGVYPGGEAMVRKQPRDTTQPAGPGGECGGTECGSARVPVCCQACTHEGRLRGSSGRARVWLPAGAAGRHATSG
jgi:hypothetical protein